MACSIPWGLSCCHSKLYKQKMIMERKPNHCGLLTSQKGYLSIEGLEIKKAPCFIHSQLIKRKKSIWSSLNLCTTESPPWKCQRWRWGRQNINVAIVWFRNCHFFFPFYPLSIFSKLNPICNSSPIFLCPFPCLFGSLCA